MPFIKDLFSRSTQQQHEMPHQYREEREREPYIYLPTNSEQNLRYLNLQPIGLNPRSISNPRPPLYVLQPFLMHSVRPEFPAPQRDIFGYSVRSSSRKTQQYLPHPDEEQTRKPERFEHVKHFSKHKCSHADTAERALVVESRYKQPSGIIYVDGDEDAVSEQKRSAQIVKKQKKGGRTEEDEYQSIKYYDTIRLLSNVGIASRKSAG